MAITDIPPTSVVAEPIGRVFPVSSFGSQYQRRVVPAPFCKRPPCLPWNQPTIFPPSKHLYTTQKTPKNHPKNKKFRKPSSRTKKKKKTCFQKKQGKIKEKKYLEHVKAGDGAVENFLGRM